MPFKKALKKLVAAIDDYYKIKDNSFNPLESKKSDLWPAAYHEAKELLANAEEEDELGKPEIKTN